MKANLVHTWINGRRLNIRKRMNVKNASRPIAIGFICAPARLAVQPFAVIPHRINMPVNMPPKRAIPLPFLRSRENAGHGAMWIK